MMVALDRLNERWAKEGSCHLRLGLELVLVMWWSGIWVQSAASTIRLLVMK